MRDETAVEPIPLNAVPLRQAVLCANCDVISDSSHDHCLICGSASLMPLARVLTEVQCSAKLVASAPVHKQEINNNVLVLVSPEVPHRRRQRARTSVT